MACLRALRIAGLDRKQIAALVKLAPYMLFQNEQKALSW
jgi:hypothetical protein